MDCCDEQEIFPRRRFATYHSLHAVDEVAAQVVERFLQQAVDVEVGGNGPPDTSA